MKNKTSLSALLAVLFGFFIMGFCDVVGMATSYVKNDFGLSETLAGFIPSAVFFWFLLLSVPTAIVMNKIGRKRTVLVSMVITIVGMMLPFISYNLVSCMVAFAFLGIGNTILQVSLNPLLTNVVNIIILRTVYCRICLELFRILGISFPYFCCNNFDFYALAVG